MRLPMMVLSMLVSASAGQGAFQAEPVSPDEARTWQRHLVPLPKQMDLTGRFRVPARQLAIVAPDEAESLVLQAVKELKEAAGAVAETPSAQTFTLKLQVGGRGAETLEQLPNADQAYLIRPTDQRDGLLLIGGGTRGLYYAAKTMQQFIRANRKGDLLEIPAVTITDWPDMEDRGFWGCDSYSHLRWMSDRKLNIDEQISRCGVDRNKRPFVRLSAGKRQIIDEGPTYGINPLPVVLHLEQLSNSGLFEAHPELKGKDGRPGTICYSNPLFVDILVEWLLLWRAEPGVREIDVWMAENLAQQKGCQCDGCKKEDRNVLEARAIVAAWNKARRTQPDLGVRILTSEETEASNPEVFAELPEDMKIWYYHSLFTYNTAKKPMIRPYLVETARQGRWIGVCPNLCANVGTWHPFTGAQFIHYRMREFTQKGLKGFIGYAVPRLFHVWFNGEAAAEWSWNVDGRSPREFSLSYAVRQGYSNPEKFADWVEVHGPVAWAIYGSEFPAGHQRGHPGKLAALLKEGKLPEIGYVLWDVYALPWGDFKTAEQLKQGVPDAARAVQLAREIGIPQYLHESLVTQGYINALNALWELKHLVNNGRVGEADKPAARRAFTRYAQGLEQSRAALRDWEISLPDGDGNARIVGKSRDLLATMVAEMNDLASQLGCSTP